MRDDTPGFQATTQLQNINLQWNQLATFRYFPVCMGRGTGSGVVVSSVKNWGTAWQVLKRKRGCHPGASHITEMTNRGSRLGGRRVRPGGAEGDPGRWRNRRSQGRSTGLLEGGPGGYRWGEQQYSEPKKTDQVPSSAPSSHLWGLRRAPSPG